MSSLNCQILCITNHNVLFRLNSSYIQNLKKYFSVFSKSHYLIMLSVSDTNIFWLSASESVFFYIILFLIDLHYRNAFLI